MKGRLSRLRNILNKKGIEAIILSHPANISYLTSLCGEGSYLFISGKQTLLITDFRYLEEYRKKIKGSEIKIIETDGSLVNTLKQIKKKFKVKNFAFEEKCTTFYLYEKLKYVFDKRLIPDAGTVEEMRSIKDEGEIECIKKAAQITLDTLTYIKKILKPGMAEIEVAAEIERYIRLKGATKSSFDIIVASGPNSSFPHAKITQRIITHNEPVLIDLGVEYQGYKSDLTRVFFLGKINPLFKRIYGIVQRALDRAKKAIRPGISINYIDRQARGFIESKGFGECFKHSLGHGIGLETHELPRIYAKNKEILKSGMVFTLEPAIYLNNKFGVRIEEMVLVKDKGMELISGTGN
jgi:Xaa-Pro aminopeptidase